MLKQLLTIWEVRVVLLTTTFDSWTELLSARLKIPKLSCQGYKRSPKAEFNGCTLGWGMLLHSNECRNVGELSESTVK